MVVRVKVQADLRVAGREIERLTNPLQRDLRLSRELAAAEAGGNRRCQPNRVLLPVRLPGMASMFDAVSGLAQRGKNIGKLLIELRAERALSRENGRLAALFGRFGLDVGGFSTSIGDDACGLGADAIEIGLANVVKVERRQRARCSGLGASGGFDDSGHFVRTGLSRFD